MNETKKMNWPQLITAVRFGKEERFKNDVEFRTEFQRDFDRLIFSAPFRRLQNKTQVFPLPGSVFVHNRLTHSLEVSSVGRSLGNDVSREIIHRHPELTNMDVFAFGTIVSAACLAHDMGNPPFGHSGEKAIASYFKDGKGLILKDFIDKSGESLTKVQWSDITHFDGNANAFRLLTHQFDGRRKGGFVMAYSTLASIVKYPYSSNLAGNKSKFGFFDSEKNIFKKIADELGLICLSNEKDRLKYARHPLVYLVEAADDICYQIMDIEDANKLRILNDKETHELLFSFFTDDERIQISKAFEYVTDINEQVVYLRSCVINKLEHSCVDIFLRHEDEILRGTFQGSLISHLPQLQKEAYHCCEQVARERIYSCRDVVDIELAGYKIIYTLLELMMDAVVFSPSKPYSQLLVNRVSTQYQLNAPHLYERVMAVLDYISGMTDVYALDLYRKINGTSLPSL